MCNVNIPNEVLLGLHISWNINIRSSIIFPKPLSLVSYNSFSFLLKNKTKNYEGKETTSGR